MYGLNIWNGIRLKAFHLDASSIASIGTYLNVTSSYKVDSISGGYELQEVKAALDSIYFVFVTGIGNEINIHCN